MRRTHMMNVYKLDQIMVIILIDLTHTEIKISAKCKNSLAMISGWEKEKKKGFLDREQLVANEI